MYEKLVHLSTPRCQLQLLYCSIKKKIEVVVFNGKTGAKSDFFSKLDEKN